VLTQTRVKMARVQPIEILIKFLDNRMTTHTNVIKIAIPKNGGHFER